MVMSGPLTPPLHLHPSSFPLGPRSGSQPSSSSAPGSAHARSSGTPSTPALAPPTPSLSVSSYDTAPAQSTSYFNPSSTNLPSAASPQASTSSGPPAPSAAAWARALGRKQSVRTVREASEVFAEAKQLYVSGISAVEKQRKGKSSSPVAEGKEDDLAAGLFRQARKVFLEIGESARADKCTWQICMLHANRGLADKRTGRLDDAFVQFAVAQEGFRGIEDAAKEGMCAFQRSLIENARRRPGEARDHCEDAIAIFELGGPSCDGSLAMAHCELGSLLERSAPLEAIDHFKSAVALFRATAQPQKEARALYAAGLIAARARQAQVAEFHLSLAARAFLVLRSPYPHAQALYNLGKLAAHEHHLAAAVDHFSDAAQAFHDLAAREDEGWCLYRLGLVMLKSTDPELACAYFNDARVLFGEEGKVEEEAKCLLRIGEAVGKVEPGAAVDPLEQAMELFESINYSAGVELCENKLLDALDKTPPTKGSVKAIPVPTGKENQPQAEAKATHKKRKSLWTLGR